MSWIINNVPGWLMIFTFGALFVLSAVYMIRSEREQKESIIGGSAVLLTGLAIAAVGIILLAAGKSGSFGSYL